MYFAIDARVYFTDRRFFGLCGRKEKFGGGTERRYQMIGHVFKIVRNSWKSFCGIFIEQMVGMRIFRVLIQHTFEKDINSIRFTAFFLYKSLKRFNFWKDYKRK